MRGVCAGVGVGAQTRTGNIREGLSVIKGTKTGPGGWGVGRGARPARALVQASDTQSAIAGRQAEQTCDRMHLECREANSPHVELSLKMQSPLLFATELGPALLFGFFARNRPTILTNMKLNVDL